MKALSIFSIILSAVLFSNTSFAQAVKTDTIKVWGNCGMCKETIEKAATSAKATTANWDEETKILQVSFNDSKTSLQKIQQAVLSIKKCNRNWSFNRCSIINRDW